MAKSKKNKGDGFVGSFSGKIISYQCFIGEMSDPKHTWATISLVIDNADLKRVDLNFVLDLEPDSYFEAPLVHLLQPMELYGWTLKMIEENDTVTVNFKIENKDKNPIDSFSLVVDPVKKKPAKSKEVPPNKTAKDRKSQ
jgi:hypothetical protein